MAKRLIALVAPPDKMPMRRITTCATDDCDALRKLKMNIAGIGPAMQGKPFGGRRSYIFDFRNWVISSSMLGRSSSTA